MDIIFSQQVEGFVYGNAVNPGGEPGILPEPADGFKNLYECFLDYVLNIIFPNQEALAKPDQGNLVQFYQFPEGFRVAVL